MILYGTFYRTHGTFTSFIDTYYNLKKYNKEITLKLQCKHNILNYKKIMDENVKDRNSLKWFSIDDEIDDNIIITTTKALYDMIHNRYNAKLKCKHLIVLDTWEIPILKHQNKIDKLNELIKISCDECHFLSQPSHIKDIYSTKSYEYYHKFSKKRLDNLYPIHKNNGLIYCRHDIVKNEKLNYFQIKNDITEKQLFDCSEYHYVRHEKIGNEYFENIGKLIFEFIYYNKKVKYFNTNYSKPDGLTYYLKLFNIDDTYSQYLNITKQDVINKLFMKNDDLLLHLVDKFI